MFVTYINTELKHNLKSGVINEDGSNLHELLMPIPYDEPDEDLFVPANELLLDLNASIFEDENNISMFILKLHHNNSYYNCVTLEFIVIDIKPFVQI